MKNKLKSVQTYKKYKVYIYNNFIHDYLFNILFFRGSAWEDAFLDLIEQIQDKDNIFKHIRIARFASRTLDHELEKNTKSVLPYFTSTFVIMAIFSVGKWRSQTGYIFYNKILFQSF